MFGERTEVTGGLKNHRQAQAVFTALNGISQCLVSSCSERRSRLSVCRPRSTNLKALVRGRQKCTRKAAVPSCSTSNSHAENPHIDRSIHLSQENAQNSRNTPQQPYPHQPVHPHPTPTPLSPSPPETARRLPDRARIPGRDRRRS